MRKIAIIAMTIAGCGGDGHGGEPMSHHVGEVAEHVEGLRVEVEAHGQAIAAAVDLAAIAAEEARYATLHGEHHDELMHEMEEMGECTNDEMSPDTTAMTGMVGDCGDELAAHTQAMDVAADLAAAQAEETRHQGMMADMIDQMEAMNDGMMATADMFMCPMHEGKH